MITVRHAAPGGDARCVPAPPLVTREYPGRPESVREARTLVRAALGAGHPAADAAVLCASELVANAVAHTRSGLPGGTVGVAITSTLDAVEVRVRDDGGTQVPPPRGSHPARSSEHGRGLLIVDALSAEWGIVCCPGGRVAWCRVACPAAAGGSVSATQSTPARASSCRTPRAGGNNRSPERGDQPK